MKTKQYFLPLLLTGASIAPAAMANYTDHFHFTPIDLVADAGSAALLDVRGSGTALGMIRPILGRLSTATPNSRRQFIAGMELMDGTSGLTTTTLPTNPVLPTYN